MTNAACGRLSDSAATALAWPNLDLPRPEPVPRPAEVPDRIPRPRESAGWLTTCRGNQAAEPESTARSSRSRAAGLLYTETAGSDTPPRRVAAPRARRGQPLRCRIASAWRRAHRRPAAEWRMTTPPTPLRGREPGRPQR